MHKAHVDSTVRFVLEPGFLRALGGHAALDSYLEKQPKNSGTEFVMKIVLGRPGNDFSFFAVWPHHMVASRSALEHVPR